mmetsp:Transcript_73027/g.202586  ORF Transcript_73027/g.202586 Transcript_73027/m.202586 type:complete len:102 (+) Transcript_73027:113-418(+)
MAAFSNTEISIKVLEPSAKPSADLMYWGMVANAAPKDLFKLRASPTMLVKELKASIAKEKGYPTAEQRLMYFGGELEDSRTLESCGFSHTDDPLLHLIPRV